MSRGTLSTPLRDAVSDVLRHRSGADARIVDTRPVGGGCINPSRRLVTAAGDFFLKWNDGDLPGLFEREAEGLGALADAAAGTAIRVPEVVGVGGSGEGARSGFLLLEFVSGGSPGRTYGRDLGEGLAKMHDPARTGAEPDAPHGGRGPAGGAGGGNRDRDPADAAAWGWESDNWIGSLPQSNRGRGEWADFWWEERIRPQWERAREAGLLASAADDRLFERVGRALPAVLTAGGRDGPSLLHGDLWSGNVYAGPDGEPVLVDPAVYRGHREVDLAMAELFGGFPADFLPAYRGAWPLEDGYADVRRAAYQLYPLLVHVNLFGAGYASRARAAAGRVAEAGG